ncbi:MAG: hypothetical protein H6853_07695 [Rhodospirillales bacterium]|nr:hypothetical protein [Alphaproteobacteria bacterium]USO03403.1 MAG: hypothetical protein H6853_07695 [Rhodospirillales bacterium]
MIPFEKPATSDSEKIGLINYFYRASNNEIAHICKKAGQIIRQDAHNAFWVELRRNTYRAPIFGGERCAGPEVLAAHQALLLGQEFLEDRKEGGDFNPYEFMNVQKPSGLKIA